GGFGEIRLGRDYAPTEWNTYFEPFGAVGVGTSGIFTYGAGASLGSPVGTAPASTLRKDNSLGYFLPAMGGVYGQAMVSAGEGIDGNKYIGGRIGYAAGPIDVAVAVGNTDLVSGTDFKQSNVMFNYNFGFAKLHTFYDVKKWSPRQQKVLSVGATVPMGAGVFKLALANADRSGGAVGSGFGDADDSRLMAVGYEHNLSKRSALYTTYSRVTNKGAARSSVVLSAPAGMLGGETSTGLELGVRHRF
ncbi:MAG TPA: porin, partial [Polyangiaceae bacterium]|nr:porin [Polyangiaceae bacterium]